MLHPQTSSQVAKDQLTMKDKRDEEEKLEKIKKKKTFKSSQNKTVTMSWLESTQHVTKNS